MLLLLTAATAAAAAGFDDIIATFERDTRRQSPLAHRDRYETLVREVTGLSIPAEVKTTLKERGVAREEVMEELLKHETAAGANGSAGYDAMLKALGLREAGADPKKEFYENAYSDIAGLYFPEKKELVLMKGAGPREASQVFFHELIHAAQDGAVGLKALEKAHAGTFDEALALRAAVEGEAVLGESILRARQNARDKNSVELLKEGYLKYEREGLNEPIATATTALHAFPYTFGAVFAFKRHLIDKTDFVEILRHPPISTEQVMHHDKLRRNETPREPPLQQSDESEYPSWKAVFANRMGEYFIKAVLDDALPRTAAANRAAAAGWDGDFLVVFSEGNRTFMVWETLWESGRDAREFHGAAGNLSRQLAKKGVSLYAKMTANRVLITSGGMVADERQALRHKLGYH